MRALKLRVRFTKSRGVGFQDGGASVQLGLAMRTLATFLMCFFLAPVARAELEAVKSESSSKFSLRVVSEDGDPVPHARLRFLLRLASFPSDFFGGTEEASPSAPVYEVDSDGYYTCTPIPYFRDLEVEASGFRPQIVSRQHRTLQFEQRSEWDGEIAYTTTTLTGTVVMAREEGFVRGRVMDRGGQPIGGARVAAFDMMTGWEKSEAARAPSGGDRADRPAARRMPSRGTTYLGQTLSGPDGRYVLHGFPAKGHGYILARADGYARFGDPDPRVAGDVVDIILDGPGAQVSGRVTMGDGSPAMGEMRLTNFDRLRRDPKAGSHPVSAMAEQRKITLDEEGRFATRADLTPGRYSYHFTLNRKGSGLPGYDLQGEFQLVPGQHKELRLTYDLPAILIGRAVTQETGAPLEGVRFVNMVWGGEGESAESAADGTFRLQLQASASAADGYPHAYVRVEAPEPYTCLSCDSSAHLRLPFFTPGQEIETEVVLKLGASIRGHVKLPAGLDPEKVSVRLVSQKDPGNEQETFLDKSSAFEFIVPANHPCAIGVATSQGWAHAEVQSPASSDPPLEVALALQDWASVSGCVVDTQGAGIPNVEIAVAGDPTRRAFREPLQRRTDNSGRFLLDRVVPGPVLVFARPSLEAGITQSIEPQALLLKVGGHGGPLTFSLKQTGQVHGIVLSENDEEPLAGFTVGISSWIDGTPMSPQITGEDGRFVLDQVPFDEEVYIVARGTGYHSRTIKTAVTDEEVRFRLRKTRVLTVRAVDEATGEPIESFHWRLRTLHPRSTAKDEERFSYGVEPRLNKVGNRDGTFEISRGWFSTKTEIEVRELGSADELTGRLGAAAVSPDSDLVIVPVHRETSLSGRVLGADGRPIPNIPVGIHLGLERRDDGPNSRFFPLPKGISDESGRFLLQGLAPGYYGLTVTPDSGYGLRSPVGLRIEREPAAQSIIVLPSTSGVRGTLLDRDGNPVPHAQMSLKPVHWSWSGSSHSLKTDSWGRFERFGVPEGQYELNVYGEKYLRRTVRLDLAPDEVVEQNLDFRDTELVAIEVHLNDTPVQGLPFPHEAVPVGRMTGGSGIGFYAGRDGRLITALPAGDYEIVGRWSGNAVRSGVTIHVPEDTSSRQDPIPVNWQVQDVALEIRPPVTDTDAINWTSDSIRMTVSRVDHSWAMPIRVSPGPETIIPDVPAGGWTFHCEVWSRQKLIGDSGIINVEPGQLARGVIELSPENDKGEKE